MIRPRPLRQHFREHALAAQEYASQVDVDDLAPHGLVELVDIEVTIQHAGDVDHDLDRTQVTHCCRQGGVDLGSAGNIRTVACSDAAGFAYRVGRRAGRVRVEVDRGDPGAAARECKRGGVADTGTRAGNDGKAVFHGSLLRAR